MKYEIDKCGFCGACVAICPYELLELTENKLIINEGCENCGKCPIVCPLGALTMEDHS